LKSVCSAMAMSTTPTDPTDSVRALW
jgi:hypothetical protein